MTVIMNKNIIYKVTFLQDESVFEIYAKHVAESEMFGFLSIENILFGEKSSVVVDPSEERLKAEFSGVNRTYIPMHAVLRIDEVAKQGTAKIKSTAKDTSNKVTPFSKSIIKPSIDEPIN